MTRKEPDDDISDRTVIRGPVAPRPAGAPAPAMEDSATVFVPGGAAWPAGPSSASETVFLAAPPVADSASRNAAPSGVSPARLDGIRYGSANPLLSAAAPLLMLLGGLRLQPARQDVAALADQVAAAIEAFELKVIKSDAVSPRDAGIAKYVLCAMADDIAGHLPGHAGWSRHAMLARFFGAADSGTGFFEALNSVLAAPEGRSDVLELMHACLSLGFLGQYRNAGASADDLQRIRTDVYETLRYFRARPPQDISPRWQGAPSARPQRRRRVPLWGVAAAAAAVVAGTFFALRTTVTAEGEAAATELLALNPAAPVTIQRAGIVPVAEPAKPAAAAPQTEPQEPVAPPRLERIRSLLGDDIAAGRLSVGSKGDFVTIEIDNRQIFATGGAKATKDFEPIAARIAAALDPEAGAIRIVGHTDTVKPRKSSPFKSNFDLSQARAKAVAAVLTPHLKDAARISAEGKGEDEPIADNATADGRAKNRRVDILIAREDEPAADKADATP